MTTLIVTLLVLAALGAVVWYLIENLDGETKRDIKDRLTGVFDWAEARGYFRRLPAFQRRAEYLLDYPHLAILEENYETIRKECEQLLTMKERITDVENLGGGYTEGGIHAIAWKSFMFKSGRFLESNCRLAPGTAALLRRIPNLYTAFFSIVEPHQYITPHFGYYKGFVRYHLGVIVPGNNVDHKAWLRVNADKADNDLDDHSLIERGERYYWHEGEGVVFDDTYLHDAANETDEIRVVLWLDIARKLPWWLHLYNRLLLFVVHQEPSIKSIRKNAAIAA